MTIRSASLALLATLYLIFGAVSAVAQTAPDFIFEIRTNGGSGGPFSAFTVAPSSWSNDYNSDTGSLERRYGFSGSVSGNVLTTTGYAYQTGTKSAGGVQSNVSAQYSVNVWVKGPKSVVINASTTGSVSAEGTGSSVNVWRAYYNDIPWADSDLFVEAQGASSDSDTTSISENTGPSLTCGASGSRTFTAYPGVLYYPATSSGDFGSLSNIDGSGFGSTNASGTTTFTATIGSDDPVMVFTGPFVGGVSAPEPSLGDTVSFTNASYDPDNQAGTTALTGICTAAWTVTYPDNTTASFTTLSGISFTASKSGGYSVRLVVTDNEGVTAEQTKTFVVTRREPTPGEGGQSCGSDSGSGAQSSSGMYSGADSNAKGFAQGVNPATGNAYVVIYDPVKTRGYPLSNRIYINTQTHDSTRTTIFGNASFTYGMEVRQMPVRTGATTTQAHWFVVDGDGQEIDFGPASSAPTPGAGVFSQLTSTSGGYTLTGAGAPGSAEEAGNFAYEFDSNGKLLGIIDPQGNSQPLTYDSSGYLTDVEDVSSDKTLTFEYDTPGLVARVVENGSGSVTHLGYTSGRLSSVAIKDSLGATVRSLAITYNAEGQIATVTRDGNSASTVTYTYQDGGYGLKLANATYSGGGTNFKYGLVPGTGAAHRVSQTNAKGGVYYFDYDSKQDLIAVTFPSIYGATATVKYTYTYDSNHLLTNFSNGATSYTLTYATNGLLTRIEDSAGNYRQYTYSGADLTKVEDNIGTLLELGYTDTNQPHVPTTIEDGAGNVWTQTLNTYGQVTAITPPTGSPQGATQFTYDENAASPYFGYLASITNGNGESVTVDSYSALGDVTSVTTYPDVSTTSTETFAYDAAQRLIGETHPDATYTEFEYTGRDLAKYTDEAGTEVTFGYCATCGAMTEMHEPLSKSQYWSLDGDHDLTQFTDGRGKNTVYQVGLASESKRMTLPDGKYRDYKYDNYGRMNRLMHWSSTKTGTFSFNSAGRVSGLDFGTNNAANSSYTYNADGSLSTHSGHGQFPLNATYTYTPARLVESVTYNYSSRGLTNNQKLEYTYNPDQSRATMVWKNGTTTVCTWTYSYDLAGRLSSISNSFGETISYAYDGEGKVTTQTNANGTTVNYTYNEDRDWPTVIDHKLSGASFAKYTLTYDGGSNTVGNLTGVTELSGDTMSYGYDALYRLTSETRTGSNAYTKTYGYDLAGNITTLNGSAFATYDDANKISTITGGSASYTEPTFFSVSGTGVPNGTFNYDDLGRLTQQRLNSAQSHSYATDGIGRRVWASNSSGNRYYVYDGDRVVGELSGSTANIAYTWGADGLASERIIGSNKSLYYHFGPQGETRALTNSSGTVVDTYLYTAYGVTVATTGTDANHHRYGGKFGYYTDGPNGIMLALNRWYHPSLMRWLSRDPILYEGGTNLYEYVGGNPVKYVDPSGLDARNYSPNPIWVKPEETGKVPFLLPPNTVYEGAIDGVKLNSPGAPWYKVPGKDRSAPDVTVCEDGSFVETGGTWITRHVRRLPIDWPQNWITDHFPGLKAEPSWSSRHPDWKTP